MSNMNKDEILEQERATLVTNIIRDRLNAIVSETGDIKEEIIDIKANFWDDVTVNFEDAAETAETYASMKQQAELLSERERSYRLLTDQVRTLRKLEQSAYFGRIDMIEEGGASESIYLGVGSLLDESGENYLVYDWRAPISSVYYDYGPGPVQYVTPSGVIHGEMTLKRQFILRYGKLLGMFDTGITIGDEILQEVLGKQSDAQMKSIVATIQQEQNQIIRNEKAKLLVVQGAAGSGKTSAALQRVAYLLYRYRDFINAEQIVLFSPNPMFNSYVSTVLPELGEQNMQQTTYQQYLEHRLGRSFELEDPFTQMEYSLTAYDEPLYEVRMDSIKLKAEISFMDEIDRYTTNLAVNGMRFKNIAHRGKCLITEEAIADYFYSLDTNMSMPNRLQEVTRYLLKQLTHSAKEEAKSAKWVDEEIEFANEGLYLEAEQFLRKKNRQHQRDASFNDFQSVRDYVAMKIVQREFKHLRRAVKLLKYVDVNRMFIDMMQQVSLSNVSDERWKQIANLTINHIKHKKMLYEDATPYLYFKEKLEGFHTNTSIKYVFIDEGQDYSPFQYQFLKRIFPRSKMTILGDFNQSIFIHAAMQENFEPYANVYNESEIERMTLLNSYRSTYEIVKFTSRMINNGNQIIPFERHGKEPAIVGATLSEYDERIDEQLHAWLRAGYESIAIICKTQEETDQVYESLHQRWHALIKLDQNSSSFPKGIMVLPSYLAKGVEFDCVIIYNASEAVYHRETERKLFYTACTRAMHELTLFYQQQLTPFLS